jgi:hypothetical protein
VFPIAERKRFADCPADHKRGGPGLDLELTHTLGRRQVNPIVLVKWRRDCGRVAAKSTMESPTDEITLRSNLNEALPGANANSDYAALRSGSERVWIRAG